MQQFQTIAGEGVCRYVVFEIENTNELSLIRNGRAEYRLRSFPHDVVVVGEHALLAGITQHHVLFCRMHIVDCRYDENERRHEKDKMFSEWV